MNNTCSKALSTLLPQQACVVLHIYSFSIFILEYTVPMLWIIRAEGTIIHIKSSPIARYLIQSPWWVQTSYNNVLRKFRQLTTFRHQRDSNPQP